MRALPADEQQRRAALARFRAALPADELRRREEALRDRKRAARHECPLTVAAAGTRLLVQDGSGLGIWDVASGKNVRIALNTKGIIADSPAAISRDVQDKPHCISPVHHRSTVVGRC